MFQDNGNRDLIPSCPIDPLAANAILLIMLGLAKAWQICLRDVSAWQGCAAGAHGLELPACWEWRNRVFRVLGDSFKLNPVYDGYRCANRLSRIEPKDLS